MPGEVQIRNFIFTAEVVRHWNKLPRKVMEAPSLEVLKMDVAGGFRVIIMVT